MPNTRPPHTKAWLHALLLAGLLLVLQAGGHGIKEFCLYSRGALLHEEWWRLLTSHFVHLGWAHTALNAAGVLLCCALAPQLFNRLVWLKTAMLAIGVGLLLWLLSPSVGNYMGFSGVLYGLFALGLAPQAWRGNRSAALALAFTAGWMLWQWMVSPSSAEEALIGGNIIGVAHVYGFGLGLTGALASWHLHKKHPDKHKHTVLRF